MGGYVAAIWGWDEQVQRVFHARGFNPGRWQIITADGADADMLDVEYRPGEIYLAASRSSPAIRDSGSAADSSAGSPPRPGRKARISSWTCSPSTIAPRRSTSDLAWSK
jgi:hypothetical protein